MHSTVRNPESPSMNGVPGTKSSQPAIANVPHRIQGGASDSIMGTQVVKLKMHWGSPAGSPRNRNWMPV